MSGQLLHGHGLFHQGLDHFGPSLVPQKPKGRQLPLIEPFLFILLLQGRLYGHTKVHKKAVPFRLHTGNGRLFLLGKHCIKLARRLRAKLSGGLYAAFP